MNSMIIDGVEVEHCRYYSNSDCLINNAGNLNLCKWHEDCYYKQLQKYKPYKEIALRLKDKYNDLFDEKEIQKELKNHFIEENNKYEKALKEIRILATKNVCFENFVKIQNKINEVLNDV